eukprot:XP_015570808.1 alpha-galactosidase 1 isoform X2 [Ricinus communis]
MIAGVHMIVILREIWWPTGLHFHPGLKLLQIMFTARALRWESMPTLGIEHAVGECQAHLDWRRKMQRRLLPGYLAMSRALKKTKRPIFFSMCEWGDMRPALWGAKLANSWRTTDDISDSWESMLKIADLNEVYANYAKPGAWNDPDMLEVGNGGMKYSEYVVHFSIWAISKAPLLLGCDIRHMNYETMKIIGNEEVIAVNQDQLGVQARKVRMEGEREIWAGPLSGNRKVVLMVNRKTWGSPLTAHWDDIGFNSNNIVVQARDLWEHHTLEKPFQGNMTAYINPHSCKMYVLTPISSS